MSNKTLSEKSLASVFPTGEVAWEGMNDGVQREISDGLATQVERDRINGKNIIRDFFPDTTTLIAEWEDTFRLPSGQILTDEQRTARLVSSWLKKSPASYTGMNEIYEMSGFNVVARPLAETEDPRVIISENEPVTVYLTVYGSARYGQLSRSSRYGANDIISGPAVPTIFADGRLGTFIKNYISKYGVSVYGQLQNSSRYGNFLGSREIPFTPDIPDDNRYWPLIYIIESADGGFATIPAELKDAFAFLTYKIKPQIMWAIAKVVYE